MDKTLAFLYTLTFQRLLNFKIPAYLYRANGLLTSTHSGKALASGYGSYKLSKSNFSLFLRLDFLEYFVKFFYSFLFVGFFERNNHYRSLHVFSFNGNTYYIRIVYTGFAQNSMPLTCLYNFK